ncbi:MAG TPA: TonB family protein [Kofleriaceae bacterium]|nr:TonB family protein [Kofleriaceae bacterium]
MRDSVANATIGSIAIHVGLATLAYTLLVTRPVLPPPKVPKVDLVEIEPPPLIKPLPPPVQPETPKPPEAAPEPVKQPVQQRATKAVTRPATTPPPTTEQPPPTTTTSDDSGGAPVTTMEDIAPSATGVAVAKGPRTTGKVGRGGTGGGTGSGAGTGSSDAPPTPVSVATIKTRAMPKGDFSYVDASKDYPAEAKALGIEGQIRVRLIVDDAGAVKSAVLLNKLGHGLDELALERAKKIVFDPAKDTDDKPVSSVVIWTFNMTLPK